MVPTLPTTTAQLMLVAIKVIYGAIAHIRGQTFTTGSNVGGYQFNAVTLKNLNNNISNGPTHNVVIGSVSGTVMTQIGSTETAVAPNYTPGDYLTFTFDTPLTLSANTTYGFLWGTAASGFVTVNNPDGSTYSGGTAISSGDNNVPALGSLIDRNVDRVFHADLTAVPEPSSTALLGLAGFVFSLRRRLGLGTFRACPLDDSHGAATAAAG